jgi:hypothetical protein
MSKKIEMGKQYRTEADIVEVLTISRNDSTYPVVFLLPCGEIHTATEYGRHTIRSASSKDLKEVSPYDDFKTDEPVMARSDNGNFWVRRYFSHAVDGKPFTFVNGETSWTSVQTTSWHECRRPTAAELAPAATE